MKESHLNFIYLLFYFFTRYSLGVIPICFLKALLKVLMVLKPTRSLISVTDLSVFLRYLQAFETRMELI